MKGADATTFEERAEAARFLMVAPEFAAAARALGLPDPAVVESLLYGADAPSGRAATAIVALPGTSARLHLRPVRHGGIFGGLLGRALLGLARPMRELRVNAALRSAGAPVPLPVLMVGSRLAGPLWSAWVGTRHEESTRDGVALLATRPDLARVAADAAGRAVRRFHDAGGRHFDLHVKNLLFRERAGGMEALVIDLDRARILPELSASRRMTELMRLYRSLLKRGLLGTVGARGCARFLGAYTAGDRDLRRRLLSHLPREQRRVRLHALTYRSGSPLHHF